MNSFTFYLDFSYGCLTHFVLSRDPSCARLLSISVSHLNA